MTIPPELMDLVRQGIDGEEPPTDSMTMVRAWRVRMETRYGPKVWDQVWLKWLNWEQALSREIHGPHKEWLLDQPVFDMKAAEKALSWEFGQWWPAWAVKAHLVDVQPCEFENHKWRLVVDEKGTRLTCDDPCDDPRVYCDRSGRYLFPACQNIPDCDQLKFEVEVSPEWVYRSENEWWVELNGEVLMEKPGWWREKTEHLRSPEPQTEFGV